MASGLRKNLNIEKEEVSSVLILLLQSVFLGIFAGAFDVSAQSYFLEVFSADLIPKAFAYSGAVGVVITSIYSFLQSRIRFSVFAVINLLFVAIVTTGLRVGFTFFSNEDLTFVMLVLMGPLIIISFLGFWGTVGRMFSLRQGKRLFGIIDTGMIVGIIVVSYAIPVLLSFKFHILNSLYICSGSMIVALLVQIYISSRYSLKGQTENIEKSDKKRSNFLDLFREKYTVLMVSFVVLSVLAAFFIHYSFLVVTETNFPDSNALASFLGVFMGTVMVFSLVFKTFVYTRLMKTYGLKVALAIAPIILGIFVIGALFVGKFYGFTATSAGFTFFFLLTVSGKLFSKSLKDSVEVPSSKILYQSLDSDIRYDVQSRIDGTINELAALAGGLLLVGLAMISSINLLHFSFVLTIILVLWIVAAFLLHRAYKDSLTGALVKFKQTVTSDSEDNNLNERTITKSDNSGNIENILEFAPQTWNGFISRNMKPLLSGTDSLRTLTLGWISRLNIFESQNLLIDIEKSSDKKSKGIFRSLIERFKLKTSELNIETINKLAHSQLPDDRLKALVAIGKSSEEQAGSFLPLLLKDNVTDVRISAIRLVGQMKMLDYGPALIDMLDHKVYYPFAFNSLVPIVDDFLDKLDQSFNKSTSSEKLMIRIIRLMSKSETDKAIPYLLTKLDQPLSRIHIESFKALVKLDYIPDLQFRQRLIEHLYKLIGVTAWNISIKQSLREGSFSDELIDALEAEIGSSYNHVFITLSLLYDTKTIAQIKSNIETGSGESIGFSLELLDLFVDESIKANLFAILEFSNETSKIQNLQSEYPIEILHNEKIIHAIFNRDYNYLDTYTLILAIKETSKIKNYQADNNLIAHLFNPNLKVAEIATHQMFLLNKEVLYSVLSRIELQRRLELATIISNLEEKDNKYSKDNFEILKSSPLSKIISISELFQISRLFSRTVLEKGIEFKLPLSGVKDYFLYTSEGSIQILGEGNQIPVADTGDFYRIKESDFGNLKNLRIIPEKDTSLLILKGEDLKELIFDHEEIFLSVLGLFLKDRSSNSLIKQ